MNLPNKKCIMIFADPVWYVGKKVRVSIIEKLIEWQKATGSFIFIDGSFQYMPWSKSISESTSHFDPENTIRLISPTKSLCINGYRFSYASIPYRIKDDVRNIYTNIYGSGPVENAKFAHTAIEEMSSRLLTNSLIDLAKNKHKYLRDRNIISSTFDPECGYFSFEKIHVQLPRGYILMDGKYFGQTRYSDHFRINLFSIY